MAKIQARVPDEVQEVASAIIKSTGLTVSDAVRMFMTRIATDKALPLDLFQPSPETLQAIEEARTGKLIPTTIEDIIADIEEAQSEN